MSVHPPRLFLAVILTDLPVEENVEDEVELPVEEEVTLAEAIQEVHAVEAVQETLPAQKEGKTDSCPAHS